MITESAQRGSLNFTHPVPDLWHLGRKRPLEWPEGLPSQPSGRWDPADNQCHVKYLGTTKEACGVETLGKFRPSTKLQAMMALMPPGDAGIPSHLYVPIPGDFEQTRRWVKVNLPPRSRFLDVRVADTLSELQRLLAGPLSALGVKHLDQSVVQSGRYDVTQLISSWAYDDGFDGIVYTSHSGERSSAGMDLTCWAVYRHVELLQVGDIAPFSRDDPAIQWVIEHFLRVQ